MCTIFDFRTIVPGTIHVGPFRVDVIESAHPCESFSFRFSHNGRSLVYTGDTGPFDGLVELASEVDVLLAESSWTHAAGRPTDLHLSGRDAGKLAKASGARRLLVTHVPPWADAEAILAEARAAYQGETVLVRQGASYPIRPPDIG
jgi:ribonuclease BN (tRNA processing enzyme)